MGREKAAAEVTRRLKEDVNTKILFFVRTFQGRILAEDKVLVARVAEALGNNLQESQYGVIVNQFNRKAFAALSAETKRNEWLAKLWVGIEVNGQPMIRTTSLIFNPEDKDMAGETNKVKPLSDHVLEFVDACPAVEMNSSEVKPVDTTNFDAAVERMSNEDKSKPLETRLHPWCPMQ